MTIRYQGLESDVVYSRSHQGQIKYIQSESPASPQHDNISAVDWLPQILNSVLYLLSGANLQLLIDLAISIPR